MCGLNTHKYINYFMWNLASTFLYNFRFFIKNSVQYELADSLCHVRIAIWIVLDEVTISHLSGIPKYPS